MEILHHRIGRHAIEAWAPPSLSPTTPVLVMHDGALVGDLPVHEATEQAIMHLATGGAHAHGTHHA